MDPESIMIVPDESKRTNFFRDPQAFLSIRHRKKLVDYPPLTATDLAKLMRPPNDFATRDACKERADFFMKYIAPFDHDYPVVKAYTSARAQRLWSDKWLAISWVAVQGIDSMCVVVRNDDLLKLQQKLAPAHIHNVQHFVRMFWNVIISNVEDIEDIKFGGNHIPFSVVAVGPGMGCKRSGGQASEEYSAKKTSEFLQGEMKSGATFTLEKTVLTAISAFQHLFCQEFEDNQIRVYVWKNFENVGSELLRGRENPDLEELLATVRDE